MRTLQQIQRQDKVNGLEALDVQLREAKSELASSTCSGTRRACPKCGKIMAEEPKFKGLWTCPDYKVRLNDKPPFYFKCTGMLLTDEGAAQFEAVLTKLNQERN